MSDFGNKVRPKTIKEIIGQNHIRNFLNKLVEKNHKTSLILYGKPGIGKTSIAFALCNEWDVSFSYLNAATSTKKELEAFIEMSQVLIIDEMHRLNKDKQDILLPALEHGKVIVVVTTTENPFFTINPALRSRAHILELKELSNQDIFEGLQMIVKKEKMSINISDVLLKKIANVSNGDFRYSLNSLNLIEQLYKDQEITEKIITDVLPSVHFYSDKNGDGHYNLLSAFHKSLRGSDIDASLYYLALLIKSGDLIGIERRMIMVAYEDVGLGSPNVTLRVSLAVNNAKKVGFPEARIILAYAIIDLCKADKSNSAVVAIDKAMKVIENGGVYDIPLHLKDAHYKSASKLGNGVGYKYPHDYGGYVKQQYLPQEIKNIELYIRNLNDKM